LYRLLLIFFLFFSFNSLCQEVVIKEIVIDGNKTTKDFIILRELPFKKGDIFSSEDLEERIKIAERNLLNTELFSSIKLTKIPGFDDDAIIVIELKELWYIFPAPIFKLADPNFNIWWETKDFSRANYGLVYSQRNFRGRDERLSLRFQLGYSKSFKLKYETPGINKKRTLGLLFDMEYSQFGEVTTATVDNERVFFDDFSGRTKERKRFGIGLLNRPSFNMSQLFFLGYDSYKSDEMLLSLFPDHFNNGKRELSFVELTYKIRNDNVDFIPYPLQGIDWEIEGQVKGIGADKENLLANIFLSLGIHNKIGGRWSIQNGLRTKHSFYDRLPYTLQRGLGYNDRQVRGYGLYLIDGQSYALFRNNLKYNLIKPAVLYLDKRKRGFFTYPYAFYLNFFIDFAYVRDELYAQNNFLANKLIGGTGIGLDLVTKYNRVLRLEYSINDIGEHGLFLQFRKSI